MNLKLYEKTRYQNIYRNKKKKNYIVMISKPVKTSISSIDGKKILKLDEALKIRDNYKIHEQKAIETTHKEDFKTLWNNYMYHCTYILKLAYSTQLKKEKMYNKYFKKLDNVIITKENKNFWAHFINKLDCSDKQKNECLKILRSFFNWCLKEELIFVNQISSIPYYKVTKTEMKYWIPSEFTKFINTLNNDINSDNIKIKKNAYLIKILTLIEFCIGDRIGETRALTFGNISVTNKTLTISHSINYDTNSKDFLSNTKTYHSQRTVDITNKLISEIENFKSFLIKVLGYSIDDNTIILFNHETKKPYSDSHLRNLFYHYCEKAKIKKIRMYDLRHTYVATMMSEGKELYYISQRIGHSNYNTTVNRYGHLSNKTRKEIAEITDKYF